MSKNELDVLRDSILKKAKGIHISRMSESSIAERTEWLETPSYDLNRILSGNLKKGIPLKTWTMIVGPEHSFKSSFMALTLSNAQKQGMIPVVIDTEGAWDKEFVKRWGLDPDNILYIYTPWVDEIKVVLAQLLDSDQEKYAIALDSIGGIEKKKILDDALEGTPKSDQGGLQKELKPLYKLLLNLVKVKNSCALSAGHLFGNPNSYGGADEIGGGKAAKLLPDIIVSLKKGKIYDSDKNVIGNELKAITFKNRIYPPFNEAVININFKDGLDRFAGLANLATKAEIISKGGAWYSYTKDDGTIDKYQGEVKLKTLFENNEEEIINKLNVWLGETGFSTVNEEIKKNEELKEIEKEVFEDSFCEN